ncbi:MAG: hypothetical protein KTR27_06015 [Leptolyngbyaceae cyanobacterium MAG.088]|nr:hypothetical protein [Leptolyngbyaceae cyanobacterium MAG.088]
MPKHNARLTTKMPFGVAVTLAVMTMWGCNQPSVATAVNETLLSSELTSLLEEEIRQQLDTVNPQQHEKTVSVCPENLAEINVVIDSAQDKQTSALYLTKVTMIVTQNGGFQIEAGDRGNPINVDDESTPVMAVPYLINCSKVSRFNTLFGQSMVEVYADGRVQVR